MRRAVLAAVLAALWISGCGRSDRAAITDYCRGRVACGVEPDQSAGAIDACVEANLHPEGTPREQCLTTALAVCLGDCVHDHGCSVFMVNDACSCEQQSYDCPE